MRNIHQSNKIKVPKVAGILGAALLTLTYALNSLPGGFFCVILLISVLIIAFACLSIFLKNIKKNIFEALLALAGIFAAGYIFFKASPSELYRSEIMIIAKPDDAGRKKIAFRENGLISVSPRSLKAIVTNQEALCELKDDTLIIYRRTDAIDNFLADTSVIVGNRIIPFSERYDTSDANVYKELIIVEDNR